MPGPLSRAHHHADQWPRWRTLMRVSRSQLTAPTRYRRASAPIVKRPPRGGAETEPAE